MIETNSTECSVIGNSYLSFDDDISTGVSKNNRNDETATPADVLREKKSSQNKENLPPNNIKTEENKSKSKKQFEGSKLVSFKPNINPELSRDILDSLGTSFLIKDEGIDKVACEDDDEEEEEEFKETAKSLEHVNLTESLLSQWIDFFRTSVERSMKENLKTLYADLMSKKDFWKNYKRQYPQSYYNVYYLITFVQCQSYLFEEALPKLEKMEVFYNKNEKTTDLGPTDMAFFYSELANCYSNLENPNKADLYFAKASLLIRRLMEKKDIYKPHVIAYYFSALGQYFLKHRKSDNALESFEKCLDILKKMPEEGVLRPVKTILLAWCYIDFSDAYISKGTEDSYREAENFLELTVNRLKFINNEELHFMGKVERNYGQISYKRREDKLKALKHYDKASEILQETLPGESCLIKKYNDERRQICDDVYY